MLKRTLPLWAATLLLGAVSLRAEVALLIAGASDAELKPLIARLDTSKAETHGVWSFWTGKLAGKDVVLTRTEGDPLNAVAAVTLGIRRYQPRLVVTFGSARAHDPLLKPLDVVVSETFVPFDGFISPHRDLGTGAKPAEWMKLLHPMMTAGEKETRTESFAADPAALAVAKTLTVSGAGRVVAGVLGSAHQQSNEADRLAWVRATWGTSCEDFESAHIAACASLFAKPSIGLRVIVAAGAEADASLAKAQALAAELTVKLVEGLK